MRSPIGSTAGRQALQARIASQAQVAVAFTLSGHPTALHHWRPPTALVKCFPGGSPMVHVGSMHDVRNAGGARPMCSGQAVDQHAMSCSVSSTCGTTCARYMNRQSIFGRPAVQTLQLHLSTETPAGRTQARHDEIVDPERKRTCKGRTGSM